MNIEELESKLNKIAQTFEPDNNSKLRVKNIVFEAGDGAMPKKITGKTTMNPSFFKYLVPLSILGSVAIFVFTPLLFFKFKTTTTQLPIDSRDLEELSENTAKLAPESTGAQAGNDTYGYGQNNMMLKDNVANNLEFEDTTTSASQRAQSKYGILNLEINNFDADYKQVLTKLEEVKGYVVSSGISKSSNTAYADLEVRVPSSEFDAYINFLRSIAVKITAENISISDKQNQISQLSSEISELDNQIRELESKSELTAVEKSKLNSLKTNRENTENALKEVQIDTDYSTIKIQLTHTETTNSNIQTLLINAKTALVEILHFWLNAMLWLFLTIVSITPLLFLGFVGLKLIRKKRTVRNMEHRS